MELIRFYFGSSSSLLTKLFLPPLARDSLYEKAALNIRSGQLMLALSEKMSGASAADIGRLHLDPLAWRAAAHVGASILKASVANQAIYPQAFFPFEGKTNLVASGKWLSFADQPRATFLVYNLRSCAHPFPFSSLRYEVKDGRPRPPSFEGATTNSSLYPARAAAKDANDQPIVEHDASNNLAPRTQTYRIEPRFPDLIPKSIWKNRTISHEDQTARRTNKATPVESLALGEPGSERRTRPLDLALLATPDFWKNQLIPEFLHDTVAQLGLLRGLNVELLTESDSDGWTVPISMVTDEDGEIDSKLFIVEPDGNSRLRRACVFAFERKDQRVYAVAIESTPVHLTIYSAISQNSDQILEPLRSASMDFLKKYFAHAEIFSLSELIHRTFNFKIE